MGCPPEGKVMLGTVTTHLDMLAAGRSTQCFPDKPGSLIPPVHTRGHTESAPRGPHSGIYPAFSHL